MSRFRAASTITLRELLADHAPTPPPVRRELTAAQVEILVLRDLRRDGPAPADELAIVIPDRWLVMDAVRLGQQKWKIRSELGPDGVRIYSLIPDAERREILGF